VTKRETKIDLMFIAAQCSLEKIAVINQKILRELLLSRQFSFTRISRLIYAQCSVQGKHLPPHPTQYSPTPVSFKRCVNITCRIVVRTCR
jgi:hypothetical protein